MFRLLAGQRRSTLVTPRRSRHVSMTRWSGGSPPSVVRTASPTSARKRWNGCGGSSPFSSRSLPTNQSKVAGSVTSTARPEILASPPAISGSTVALRNAKRGSRWRSRALRESGIIPSHAVAEGGFDAADAGRAVGAQGRQRLVDVGVEPPLHRGHELGGGP